MHHALTRTGGVEQEARRVARSSWIGHLGRFGLGGQALTATGLLVYGLFGFAQVRYHRV